MKKILIAWFSLFLYLNTSFASPVVIEIPDEFYITEHWVSLTTSFDIETKAKKLGTLYRKFFSLLLTYEFYGPMENKVATARSRFFSFSAHFDVYDNLENLIGSAEERIFTFYPTFDIYAPDGATRLARAQMNFWGTTFTIYDPVSDQEMATMYRSFFRVKNDWSIRITNRELFERKSIDSRVLMTVLAFQGDRENWEQDKQDQRNVAGFSSKSKTISDVNPAFLNSLKEKIDYLSKQEGLDTLPDAPKDVLEKVAAELEEDFQKYPLFDEKDQSSEQKINAFADYCLDLIRSGDKTDSKKKAIISLLKMRLEKIKS